MLSSPQQSALTPALRANSSRKVSTLVPRVMTPPTTGEASTPPQPVAMATGTPDAVKASVDEVTHEEVVGVWTITTYLRASSASACDANSVASRRDNRLTSVRDDKDRCGVCMVISSYFQRSKRSLRMALSSSPIGTGCHLKRICHSARRTLKSSTKS